MQALLARTEAAFDEIAAEQCRSFIGLLVAGDAAKEGAERDLAALAVDLKLSMDDIRALAALAAELREKLPLVAQARAHRVAHTDLVRKVNESRDVMKAAIAKLEDAHKELWKAKMLSEGRGLQIVGAQTRVNWIRAEYPDLFQAVLQHDGITLPVDPPGTAKGEYGGEGTKAPAQVDSSAIAAEPMAPPSLPAESGEAPICLDEDPLPVRPAAPNIGQAFHDLRDQSRAQRRAAVERRSRE